MASQNPPQRQYSPRSPRKRSKTPRYLGLGILLIVALVAFISFLRDRIAQRAAHNTPNPISATPEVLAAARTHYDSHCASCHGSAGDGKGDKADGLWSKPTDFRDAAQMNRRTDGDLYWVITRGSWPMPAFGSQLTDSECWALVDYIRTFEAQNSGSPPAR
jgi:mono/diheme cytochrome c family protein